MLVNLDHFPREGKNKKYLKTTIKLGKCKDPTRKTKHFIFFGGGGDVYFSRILSWCIPFEGKGNCFSKSVAMCSGHVMKALTYTSAQMSRGLYTFLLPTLCLRFAYAVAVSAYAGLLGLDLPTRAYAYRYIFDFAFAACIWCFCGVCVLSCLFMLCLRGSRPVWSLSTY